MRRIFKDNILEDEISTNGYVVLKNAVDIGVCNDLFTFFSQSPTSDVRKFTISNWSNDLSYRQETYSAISQALTPVSEKYLSDYKPVMGVYTVKKPGVESDMLLHQDWSLVDESSFRSVSIWLALCDMNHINGNLQVAPQSHNYAGFPRGMNVPIPFEELRQKMMREYLIDLPLSAGDVIIFDHRLIHASPTNNGDMLRLAAVLAMIPSEADLIHYYYDPAKKNELEVLKMNEEGFRLMNFFDSPNRPPHIYKMASVPYSFQTITLPEEFNVSQITRS